MKRVLLLAVTVLLLSAAGPALAGMDGLTGQTPEYGVQSAEPQNFVTGPHYVERVWLGAQGLILALSGNTWIGTADVTMAGLLATMGSAGRVGGRPVYVEWSSNTQPVAVDLR